MPLGQMPLGPDLPPPSLFGADRYSARPDGEHVTAYKSGVGHISWDRGDPQSLTLHYHKDGRARVQESYRDR